MSVSVSVCASVSVGIPVAHLVGVAVVTAVSLTTDQLSCSVMQNDAA